MKIKTLLIILLSLPLFSCGGIVHEHSYIDGLCQECGENGFVFYENTLLRYDGNFENVIIPDSYEINGKKYDVTRISYSAFRDNQTIKSVKISNNVDSIGYGVFYNCKNLSTIIIGSNLTNIGDFAFTNCSNLTEFVVDKNNTSFASINGDLYSNDGKAIIQYCIGKTDESLIISNNVVLIEDVAFYNCKNLRSIYIPSSVITIGDDAFSYCENLTISCQVESKPDSWSLYWNTANCPVEWGK